MKLTDAKLRNLAEPGRHWDGLGLYLEILPAGGRYWRWKYRHGGKEKRLALGVYPEVSLAEARRARDDARETLRRGDDPAALRKAGKLQAEHAAANTFEVVAREWLAHQSHGWSANTLDAVTASFETHVFPKLGTLPLASMKPSEVKAVILAIEKTGASETAGRVLQRVKSVFRFAVVHDRIESNPMLDLRPGELLKPRAVRHRPALSERDLPDLLAKLEACDADPTTVNALRLLMLTAVRPGELRGARWAEIDADGLTWRIPGERMKMKAPHLVPLSTQARDVLEAQRKISGGRELVFPSPFYPTQPLSENTLNSLLARLGFKNSATAHGMRALFSTVANEAGHDPDVIERQLAHRERNEVRAAYHRAEYLAARRKLLDWWGNFLDGARRGNVVPIGAGRKGAA